MSRAITKEEARNMFLSQCEIIAEYWLNETRAETAKDKVEGAIFSIMNIFDGTCGGFPVAIDLVLRSSEEDKNDSIEHNENWIDDGLVFNDDCHLHDLIFKKR